MLSCIRLCDVLSTTVMEKKTEDPTGPLFYVLLLISNPHTITPLWFLASPLLSNLSVTTRSAIKAPPSIFSFI